ncbi:hypothetical protein H5410_054865 [Solanum commersonii]|uniref:60S ribosomal protein L38 n=1 Tax=Solanum commersonii TaxID=4109 RepID=A0A9J5WG23_SOLCO|nr:hypothetical protein H5410_054865 [Solanum commersonii]
MARANDVVYGNQQLSADPLPFARSYQLEALEAALKQNTIDYLETGSEKILIAIMLLRSIHLNLLSCLVLAKARLSPEQGDALMMHTDLKVGTYWGEMGVDFWDAATWKHQVDGHEIDMIKVIIFDECHNARGKHPYASIMMMIDNCFFQEMYHRQLTSESAQLPRIFGMTASPIKSKGPNTPDSYWRKIRDLENPMHSKVYTCDSEAVLAEYTPFSNPKLKIYKHEYILSSLSKSLTHDMERLKEKHECSISKSNLSYKSVGSAKRRVSKLYSAFLFCLSEMGVWLAFKAAEFLSQEETDFFSQIRMLNICHQSSLSSRDSSRVQDLKDLRCIIFVERIITAIVLWFLLNELLPELCGWRTEYTAGHVSVVQTQSRKIQNKIVEKFQKGVVNIIVATSILEEGLDVQSCNLLIRFDPSATVCSYIQSHGRARMQNHDFLLMVKRFHYIYGLIISHFDSNCNGDESTLTRMQNFMASGEMMPQKSLRHASIPCSPLDNEMYDEPCYKVESTGAIVTLNSSISLLYFYCPRYHQTGLYYIFLAMCVKESGSVLVLHFRLTLISIVACKELHRVGALTDNLVPDIVEEEAINKELESKYFPAELVSHFGNESEAVYYCYLVELQHETYDDFQLHGIILAVRTRLKCDDEILAFDLDVDRRGRVQVQLKYSKVVTLTSEECQRFQVSVFKILLDRDLSKLQDALAAGQSPIGSAVSDYLLLPSVGTPPEINWKCVNSLLFPSQVLGDHKHMDLCSTQDHKRSVNTKTGVGKAYFESAQLPSEEQNSKAKDSTDSFIELPPELCLVIMSPVFISTLYTYSFVPSIMHQIESLVMASHLKSMLLDDCKLNVFIPTAKVLEAVTTRKYAVSTQLFKTYENHHEGLLYVKKSKIISNVALCKFGCARKIPVAWIIPGDNSQVHSFNEEFMMSSDKMYSKIKQNIRSKRVADMAEALIGAYLSSGGEVADLSLMKWLGMDIHFVDAPIQRHFPLNAEKLVNVWYFESLLHYKLHDPSLLVGALTHGSYMLPEIPQCYQPKQIHEIKDFLLTARRKDARSVKIKKNKDMVKFKVRCSKYLYTLCVSDFEKADKLKQSLPPGLSVQDL